MELKIRYGSVLIDETDLYLLEPISWGAYLFRDRYYAAAKSSNRRLLMHRVITGAVQGQVVDHINDDGLDNQRSNLRIVTNAQNVANQRVRGTGSSIFRGVTWDVRTSKWMARINVDCKSIWLGRFSDENEAARVFDEAARKAWGEYARLNFPDR